MKEPNAPLESWPKNLSNPDDPRWMPTNDSSCPTSETVDEIPPPYQTHARSELSKTGASFVEKSQPPEKDEKDPHELPIIR